MICHFFPLPQVLATGSDGFVICIDRVFQWAMCPLALLAGVYSLWGPTAAALGISQALLSILLVRLDPIPLLNCVIFPT